MKRIPILTALAVSAALLVPGLANAKGQSQVAMKTMFTRTGAQTQRTLIVSGDAEVRVSPNEAIVKLGVETRDAELLTAKQQSDTQVTQVLRLMEQLGIEAKDIQTSYISVEPMYKDWTRTEIIGYIVHNSITVKLQDLTKLENLVIGALQAGANRIDGIEFQTTELQKHRDDARDLAIAAAQRKAQLMAKKLNHKVGWPLEVEESTRQTWAPLGAQTVSEAGGAPDTSVGTIAPGQITITAKVLIKFVLYR